MTPLTLRAYLESGVDLAATGEVAAWSFDLAHWGRCGQGPTRSEALNELRRQCLGDTVPATVDVVEHVAGDEQAFQRDLAPPTPQEVATTLEILGRVRARTITLVDGLSPAVLDREDPDRVLPDWASWHTPRQLAWHLADTESRYYLPSLGLPSRPRAGDLVTELRDSAAHVREVLSALPAEPLVARPHGEVWTSVKLLRRLAWHERGELRVLSELVGA